MKRHQWRQPESRYHQVGDLELAVREWRPTGALEAASADTVVMLHGWMDVARSFAPLVSHLDPRRRYIALDWRGFGDSARALDGRYLIPDYIADLDTILERESPGQRVLLIGHSLGGNVAGLYAGIRPERVTGVISLEGFGLPDSEPADAPGRYQRWLDQQGSRRDERVFRSRLALARRLRAWDPRLEPAMAAYLAWCRSTLDQWGRVRLAADPAHHNPNPIPYRLAETLACWRAIQAPVLWCYGEESLYYQRLKTEPDWRERQAAIRRLTLRGLKGAGHNLIHEAPANVGQLLEAHWPAG